MNPPDDRPMTTPADIPEPTDAYEPDAHSTERIQPTPGGPTTQEMPAETKPAETKPAETKPAETKQAKKRAKKRLADRAPSEPIRAHADDDQPDRRTDALGEDRSDGQADDRADEDDRELSEGRTGPLHWKQLALHTLPIYIASRAAVVAGAAVVATELRVDEEIYKSTGLGGIDVHGTDIGTNAIRPMINVFTAWDGKWYMDVVRLGYPKSVPPGVTYNIDEARTAFFPLFPALGRAFDWIVPGGDTAAVLLLNLLLGFAAVLIVGLMTQRMYGTVVSRRTVTLMSIFPGSFVFSFAYSEALMITLAALCLWAIYERRWWSAGILGALTTATRPNGVAVVVAAFAVFVNELRKPKDERDLRSVIPVVLAPLGFIAFQAYLGVHTGEPGVWFRVQREAWDEGASFGWTAIRNTFEAFANPMTSPTDTITALSLVATGLLVYFAWKVRLNLILTAYSATILVLMLAPATVTARPRFLFTAFPLLIAGSLWVEQRKSEPHVDSIWTVTTMLCGAGLAAVTGLYGVYGAIP